MSPSASSIPAHRQRHRYEHTQPQSASSVWIHLKFLHSSCAALRVSETRLHQKTLLGSCTMFGEKGVLMTCSFGVGAWYAHQERARPRNNVLRCFPPTADLPRHTCLGHHPTRNVYAGRSSEILDHERDGSLEDFAVLKATPRPTESTISSAISRICQDASLARTSLFPKLVLRVVASARNSLESFPSMLRICKALQGGALMKSRPKCGGA